MQISWARRKWIRVLAHGVKTQKKVEVVWEEETFRFVGDSQAVTEANELLNHVITQAIFMAPMRKRRVYFEQLAFTVNGRMTGRELSVTDDTAHLAGLLINLVPLDTTYGPWAYPCPLPSGPRSLARSFRRNVRAQLLRYSFLVWACVAPDQGTPSSPSHPQA